LVRISACHAEGRGFESRPLRQFLMVRTGRMVYLINCIMITDINQNNFFVGYDQFQCNTLF